MMILLIEDADTKTSLSENLLEDIRNALSLSGHQIKETQITGETVKACRGCYGCWLKKPGECVIRDALNDINRDVVHHDLVIYFGYIVFGQYSKTLKNVLDRTIPNLLPFLETMNGRTQHPRRYDRHPSKIHIGYREDCDAEEKETFARIARIRNDTKSAYVSGALRDNAAVVAAMMQDLTGGVS